MTPEHLASLTPGNLETLDLSFKELVLYLSTAFINTPVDQADRALLDALALLGRRIGSDSAFLFTCQEPGARCGVQSEWVREGASSKKRFFQEMDPREYPWFHARLGEHRPFPVPDTAAIPEEAGKERALVEGAGIRSFLVFPLILEGNLAGVLGFANDAPLQAWPEKDLRLLAIGGGMFLNFLQRVKQEQRLRLLEMGVEQTADNIIVTDREGVIEYVNPAFTRLTGYSYEEAVGKKPSLLRSARHGEGFYKTMWERILSGKPFQGDIVNKRKDGSLYYEEKSISPVFDRNGAITHFVSAGKDVTARAEAERALRESEKRHRTMIDTTSEGFWLIDTERKTVEVNRTLCDLLGYDREEMIGKSPLEFADEANREIFRAQTGKMSSTETRVYEIVLTRKDGAPLPAIFHATTLRDDDGMPVGGFAFVTDIRRLKALEASLRQANSRLEQQVETEVENRYKSLTVFRQIYQTSRFGIVLADMEGRMMETNPAFDAMLGYGPGELQYKTFSQITYREDLDRNLAYLDEVRKTGRQTYQMTKRYVRKDGGLLWAKLYVSLLSYDGGKEPMLLAMVEDTSLQHTLEEKQRRQEEMLIHQSKMAAMGEMIGAIAHQWRQPLSSLALLVQDAADAFDFGELDKAYIEDVKERSLEQIDFMNRTIDDFRTFFRPDREKRVFDGFQAIRPVLEMLTPQMKAGDIRLEVVGERESLPVLGYPNEFKQVVLNLLNNAKDAVMAVPPEDRWIKVELSRRNGTALFLILDNGGGIPGEMLEKIFQPYFSTKGEKGTGVGLHMSKTIVEEHMGGILLAENREGGALFTILLPIAENQ